jgi:pimeloyl-ACP methyl ester carboxylesterase
VDSTAEPRHHSAALNGLTFHWVEWGPPEGRPVIALHGLSSMCRIWDPLGRHLGERYRLIALDQRGHGDTSWPDEPAYGTDDYVADLEALVDRLSVSQFGLVALSMGGMNAMSFSARNPRLVSALVVVDIRPALDPDKRPNREQDRRTAAEGHMKWPNLEAAFLARKFTHPHTPDHSIRHHVQQLLKELPDGRWTNKHDPRVSYFWRPTNLWGSLGQIESPVLIVRGGKSDVLPTATAEEMRAAFRDCELCTIELAGHTVPEDQPEEFNALVDAFLSGHLT